MAFSAGEIGKAPAYVLPGLGVLWRHVACLVYGGNRRSARTPACPKAVRTKLPALPKFPEGWQLDKPDLGADIYRN